MADDHDYDAPHEFANPFEELLGRMFGGGPAEAGPRYDKKAERAAFLKARFTAVRAAKALMAPQHQTKAVFGLHLRDDVFDPLTANPLVPDADTEKLFAALDAATGRMRESDRGRPPREEKWGDVLHDEWFEHIAEHVAFHLWLHLHGVPDEKEAMLEEIIPVLEKFGGAILGTFQRYATAPDAEGNSPIGAAGKCATRALKPRLIEKAKELGLAHFAAPPLRKDGDKWGDPGPEMGDR